MRHGGSRRKSLQDLQRMQIADRMFALICLNLRPSDNRPGDHPVRNDDHERARQIAHPYRSLRILKSRICAFAHRLRGCTRCRRAISIPPWCGPSAACLTTAQSSPRFRLRIRSCKSARAVRPGLPTLRSRNSSSRWQGREALLSCSGIKRGSTNGT